MIFPNDSQRVAILLYAPDPCCRLDLREGDEKKEFVDHDVRGRVRSDITGSFLAFDPLVGSDTGIYKCRVDFENSPTLAALVNLTVYGKGLGVVE